MTPERIEIPTINALVNNALLQWGKVVGISSNDISWGLRALTEALNDSRDLDPCGLTTFMMLRGLTEWHLKETSFSAFDLILDPQSVSPKLEDMRQLRTILEHPDVLLLVDEFENKIRDAATHYGIPLTRIDRKLHEDCWTHKVEYRETEVNVKQELEDLLNDKHALAFLRRDALRSMETLEAHQFMQGKGSAEPLKLNKFVYEFWNINSLLAALREQGLPGITLCLIRDPIEALASFFCVAIRNGETITILTDRTKEAYPGQRYVRRRPDRQLEDRANRHWFPYHLLDLEVTEDQRAIYTKARQALVPLNTQAVQLKRVVELGAGEFVWLWLVADLVAERYGTNNLLLSETSYTAQMVREPQALIGSTSALVVSGQYKPLELPALKVEDVSFDATKDQWDYDGGTHFNAWMEERYSAQVQEEYLNPVGSEETKLLEVHIKKSGLPIEYNLGDRGWAHEKGQIQLQTLDPLTFGTKAEIEKDRKWVGRTNKMQIVQSLAQQEFLEKLPNTLQWMNKRAKVQAQRYLDLVSRNEWNTLLKKYSPGFNVGDMEFEKGNGLYRRIVKGSRTPLEFYRSDEYVVLCDERRGYPQTFGCFFHNDIRAQVFGFLVPHTPEGIADLYGSEVKDLPFGLQHWYKEAPYQGNSILNRVEPTDLLKNPWMTVHPQVCIALCKNCIHSRRKELGLPRESLSADKKDNE